MNGLVQTAIKATASPNMAVVWDDVEGQPSSADPAAPWARVRIMHTKGQQASLSGAQNIQRYVRGGIITVQLFTPTADAKVSHDQIVPIIMSGFEKGVTPGGILFRKVRFTEVGVSGDWSQTNIMADFEYDEYK